ncbi:MAG: hypothetical protein ABL967_13440 [Bryobacteraceae bacterium]
METLTSAASLIGSMPIPMTTGEIATEGKSEKKDRTYFSRAMQTATIALYRSGKAVADLLLDARLTLSPEEFQAFVAEDCQFDTSLVYKFIKMAADFRLNDPKNQLLLPEAWTLRYEIMMMKEDTFRVGVTKGIIHANCNLADLKQLREQLEPPKRKRSDTPSQQPAPRMAEPEPKATAEASVNSTDQVSAEKKKSDNPAKRVSKPRKGRISIVVSKAVAEEHADVLDRLKEQIKALTSEFDFISGVDLEVAA